MSLEFLQQKATISPEWVAAVNQDRERLGRENHALRDEVKQLKSHINKLIADVARLKARDMERIGE